MDRLAGSKPRSGLPKVAERPHGMLAKQKGASLRLAVDLSLLYCSLYWDDITGWKSSGYFVGWDSVRSDRKRLKIDEETDQRLKDGLSIGTRR